MTQYMAGVLAMLLFTLALEHFGAGSLQAYHFDIVREIQVAFCSTMNFWNSVSM